jgi:hypothetical protein
VLWSVLQIFPIFPVYAQTDISWARPEVRLLKGVPSLPAPDIAGIKPMGMGNAGLALSDGAESFFLNPAGLGLYRDSYVEAGFYFHTAAANRIFNATIADGRTNPMLSGGLGYSYYMAPRAADGKIEHISGHIVRLATAYRWQNTISIGLVLKLIHLDRPFFTPITGVNLDLGLTWQIIPYLSISAVGYNLVYNDSGETPIAIGFGAAFQHPVGLRIAADWIVDFQSRQKIANEIGHELRLGASFTIVKVFTIRAGYHFDHVRDGHFLSFGLGFQHKIFGLEAAFRQQISPSEYLQNRLLGFTVLFYF